MGLPYINTNFIPQYSSIKESVSSTKEYMIKKKNGEIQSAKTEFPILNNNLLDGIPFDSIISIAAQSSAGKSTLMDQIKYYFLDTIPNLRILSVECEMSLKSLLFRQVCKKTGLTLKQLEYIKGHEMDEAEEALAFETLDILAQKKLNSIEISPTLTELKHNILYYIAEQDLQEGDNFILTIDHLGLIRPEGSSSEKKTLDDLFLFLIELKSMLFKQKINFIAICLSQLNRGVFNPTRTSDPRLHLPEASDIYGSSSVFQGSDIVFVLMCPNKIGGIASLGKYTTYNYPILQQHTQLPYLYLHMLKSRYSEPCIIPMLANFKRFHIYETTI